MVPFERKWEKRRGKKYPAERKYPLFPCYVFAGFRHVGEFIAAKTYINGMAEAKGKAPPIVALVGYGSRPAVLSAADVSLLQGLSTPRPTSVNLHKAIQPGGNAQIIDGPFSGQIVKVDSVTRKKARVILQLLNSMQSVEIDAGSLVAA
jgi:transcription antitermination factor NusG